MSIILPCDDVENFKPTFSPVSRDGQLLWRASWLGCSGIGITQQAALEQLQRIAIAQGLLVVVGEQP
jgi:hypothetical protein